MSKKAKCIEKQLDVLRHFIQEHIDADYIYVDVPLHLNIGDWFIALGAWELLKSIPYKCIDRVDWKHLDTSKINKGTIILLHGGGNFGDIWRSAVEGRNELIQQFPNNKVIILPQTITYTDKSLLKKDAAFYSNYPNVHICARDEESYKLAKQYFVKNEISLLPDTAIGLYNVLPKGNGCVSGKQLIINRKDKEADKLFEENGDIKDWDDILKDIHFKNILLPYKIIKKIRKLNPCKVINKLEMWYAITIMYGYILKQIPKYFLRYDLIKTTRLHGYLIASMLHIPIDILDTKYNKIQNYRQTWMQ